MKNLDDLNVKIFADGADKDSMIKMYNKSIIKGLTTNPTLMKKAGVLNYEDFSKDILKIIKTKSLSLEVFSDELVEMKRQAIEISKWASNVYVKIPITNTAKESTLNIIEELSSNGVKVNVTAIMTIEQVKEPKKKKNRTGLLLLLIAGGGAGYAFSSGMLDSDDESNVELELPPGPPN